MKTRRLFLNLLVHFGKYLPLCELEISHLANEGVELGHWFLIPFPILPAQLKNEIMVLSYPDFLGEGKSGVWRVHI